MLHNLLFYNLLFYKPIVLWAICFQVLDLIVCEAIDWVGDGPPVDQPIVL